MASSQASSPLQLQRPAFSPLDQIALNAGQDHSAPSSPYYNGAPATTKSAILERAASLARNATITKRPGQEARHGPSGQDVAASHRIGQQQQEQIQTMRLARIQHQHTHASPQQAESSRLGANLRQPIQAAVSAPSSPTDRQEAPVVSHKGGNSVDSTFGLGNAFRDSVASDMSFSSLSGAQDRASIMGFGAASDNGEGTSLDRIADEVRGLALRRRQSMDTVRSSEFGEGGRWAQAWGSSDAGDDDRSYVGADDDDEEDEERHYALQAHAMSAFDIENANGPALGGLNRFDRAGRNARSGHGSDALPTIQQAPSAEHIVKLTPSMRSTRPNGGSTLLSLDSRPSRRDTITSIAADISGDASIEDEPIQAPAARGHERTTSESTISNESVYSDANSHVRVWPPTPGGSEANHQASRPTLNFARPTRSMNAAAPAPAQGASGEQPDPSRGVFAQQQQQPRPQHPARPPPQRPAKPMSPSAALAEPLGQPILNSFPTTRQNATGNSASPGSSYSTYADVNLPMYPAGLDSLGEKRRKAIADHDGRESLVSDLDVETLRLDGSSNSSGSSQDWESRRASTSTVGTVSSMTLEEQRRRRSQLERIQETDSDRRQSIMTIRGNDEGRQSPMTDASSQQSPSSTAAQYLANAPRRRGTIHSPDSEHPDPMQAAYRPPRRSNTQPMGPPSPVYGSPNPSTVASPRFGAPNALPSQPSITSLRNGASTPIDNRSPSLAASTFSPNSQLSSGASYTGTFTSSPSTRRSGKNGTPATQSKAEHFLTLGIQHHESGDLSRSAYYFERSAKIEGGCVVGMCMWGMALREGWGVRKDQKRGFDWISRAAARAGELMNSGTTQQVSRTEAELKAIRSELKLSVYELGKCFCYGWGVKMDKQMALEYFELAAKLGDADAQAEAGALLAAGKGCKKDLKKAAMYYRMAEAQGYDTVGLSWIHKDKYDPVLRTK